MDNALRLQYLEAMGIDVWLPRDAESAKGFTSIDDVDLQLDEVESQDVAQTVVEDNWEDLRKQVEECRQCELCQTRKQTVFGTGSHKADWMLIGEAPGENEDLQGVPFVGPAGKLLTEMIRAIGLEREAVYIANIVKCRPPNNRDPKHEEIKTCNDFLQRQIKLVQPKIILAIGRVAAQTLLQSNAPLSKLRGVPHQLAGIPLIVVYHPAYLLRSLLEKRKAWQDLQLAMKLIEKSNNNEYMEDNRYS